MSLSKKFEKHIGIIILLCKNSIEKNIVQKLMYLVERNGIELDLNFYIHYYGPYSSKLEYILDYMIVENMLQVASVKEKRMFKLGSYVPEFENKLTDEEISKTLFVLNNFKNKNFIELEGITTVDFFMQKDLLTSDIKIIEDIKRSTGTKFENIKLEDYFETLRVHGYIN